MEVVPDYEPFQSRKLAFTLMVTQSSLKPSMEFFGQTQVSTLIEIIFLPRINVE
jgi:hypothetical protein